MSGGDGAHLNVGADRALKTIVGGEKQPTHDDGVMSDEVFEHMIRTAKPGDYGETANFAARRILEFWEAHPEHLETPGENVYADGAFQNVTGPPWPEPIKRGLYDVLKEHRWGVDALDLTGFMWGWAFNAARKIRGMGPVANPAIIEL